MSEDYYKQIFSKNLIKLMNKNNISQTDIIRDLKINKSTISTWCNGSRLPRMDMIDNLANYFGVNKSDLIEDKSNSDENIYTQLDMSYIKVPLYGDISCGAGGFVDDNIIDYIAVPDDGLNSSKEYFAQVANGDSMVDAGINEGDVIVFEKSNVIEDGKIGCFCIDDNVATCKKFKKGKAFIQLIPANHNYDPIVIDLQDNNFRVIGVLKKSIKSFD